MWVVIPSKGLSVNLDNARSLRVVDAVTTRDGIETPVWRVIAQAGGYQDGIKETIFQSGCKLEAFAVHILIAEMFGRHYVNVESPEFAERWEKARERLEAEEKPPAAPATEQAGFVDAEKIVDRAAGANVDSSVWRVPVEPLPPGEDTRFRFVEIPSSSRRPCDYNRCPAVAVWRIGVRVARLAPGTAAEGPGYVDYAEVCQRHADLFAQNARIEPPRPAR